MGTPLTTIAARLASLTQRHAAGCLALLIAGTLIIGAAYAHQLGDRLRYPDERDYVALARNLVAYGHYTFDGQTPTAYRPPGYPMLLATLAYAGGGVASFRLLNMAAFGVSLLLIFALVRREGGPPAGLLAAALAAAYPLNLYTAGTLYPQTVAGTLLLAAAWLALPTPWPAWRAAGLGLAIGALTLCVPTFLALGGATALWALVRTRGRGWRGVIVMIIVAGAVVLPWTLRNARALGTFVPVSTNSGVNLLLGNAEHATAGAGVNVDISEYRAAAQGLSEVERNRFFTQAALDAMRAHPARTAGRYILKFLNHFHFRNTLYTASESTAWRDALLLLTYWPLLAVVVWRMTRAPPRGFEQLALLLYVVGGLAFAVFFTRIRFRVPLDLLLIAVAALAVTRESARARPAE